MVKPITPKPKKPTKKPDDCKNALDPTSSWTSACNLVGKSAASGVLKKLMAMAPAREVIARSSFDPKHADWTHGASREALLAQFVGTSQDPECSHCSRGAGPFVGCVVVRGKFGGACANCLFINKGDRCSVRKKSNMPSTPHDSGTKRQNESPHLAVDPKTKKVRENKLASEEGKEEVDDGYADADADDEQDDNVTRDAKVTATKSGTHWTRRMHLAFQNAASCFDAAAEGLSNLATAANLCAQALAVEDYDEEYCVEDEEAERDGEGDGQLEEMLRAVLERPSQVKKSKGRSAAKDKKARK
ncbi:hypothetical protein BJX61DRAFT_543265 [Aspergillus egyptiacus]|nr:hypothetical protein BJX61DRAFT_543265 [Aspergillus egyptiacus]